MALLSCLAWPAGATTDALRKTYVLSLENDTRLFSLHDNSDRFYSNGWRYGQFWSSDDKKDLPLWLTTVGDWLPFAGMLDDISMAGPTLRAVGVHVGQNMYTPSNIDSVALIEADRPYAGWLYAGLVTSAFSPRADEGKVPAGFNRGTSLARVRSVELDVGVVGPGSGAQQFQTKWHGIIGIHKPKGWANQIHNEVGVLLMYDLRWKNHEFIRKQGTNDYRRNFDLITHVGGSAGNVFTNLRSSVSARAGWNLSDDFGPGARIEAAEPIRGRQKRPKVEFYVFGRGEARGVVQNIFLEGNTFAQSHRVEPRRFVADLEWGSSLRLGWFRVTHRQVHRSREFVNQLEQQIFGCVMFSVEPQPK